MSRFTARDTENEEMTAHETEPPATKGKLKKIGERLEGKGDAIVLGLGLALFIVPAATVVVPLASYFNSLPSNAQQVGVAIEEEIVSNPLKKIPLTDQFVTYPDYMLSLHFDPNESHEVLKTANYYTENGAEDPDNVMVKVIKGDGSNASEFIVCTYYNDIFDKDKATFSTATGEELPENSTKCF